MAEFIEFLSDSALAELKKANAELVTMVANVDNVGKKMKNISTPSGSDSAIKSLTEQYKQQEAVIVKLQTQIQKLVEKKNVENNAIAKTMRALENETKSRQALDAQRQKALTVIDKENAKLKASENVYNKVQAKLNALSNEYKALATRKELGATLTDKEAKRYDFLQGKITKYDATLKAVDATMGKYQRNVGNYSSAFNPLSNSINQLTREMPAFANSVQTGFMAISNNLPIFFDAIQQANSEIKLLRANGEATPSLFQKLTSSVLSWGTALSVGVTLLTVFGDEIIDAIFNTKAKAKADEEAKKKIEEKNNAEKEYIDTMRNSASEEISRSQILFANAKNVNMSMADRLKAIKELKERYPDYLKELSNEAILAGETAEAENKLNEALMKRGIAIALQGKLTEKYNELTAVLLAINETQNKANTLTKEEMALASKLGVSNKQLIKDKEMINNLVISNANRSKKAIEEEIAKIFDLYNQYAPYLSAVNESTDATDKSTKKDREKIEALELTKAKVDSLIRSLEEEKAMIEELQIANSNNLEQWNMYQKAIDQVQTSIDNIKNGYKDLHDSAMLATDGFIANEKAIESGKEKVEAYNQAVRDSLEIFQSEFFSEAGFPTLFKALNDDILGFGKNFEVTFNTITEIAQEAYNFIAELSNQRFQAQYDNLAKEKEVALRFAGESASAREEVERQYEQKQKEIRKREFKAQKQQALFNIAINGAQAIIATLARTPLPLGLPLVLATSALTAVQLGVVASQKVPEFWTGTDNAPEGLALTQERGREIITDKSGKIKSLGSDKGAELTYLNKGDKVFNADKTMEMLMFDNSLNNMLNNSGISMPNIEVNTPKIDLQPLIDVIKNKDSVVFNYDQNGARISRVTENQTIEYANRRAQGIGKIF
jgi:hypothetical protein